MSRYFESGDELEGGRHRQVKKNACRWNVVIVKYTAHTNLSLSARSTPSPSGNLSEKQDLRVQGTN